MARPLTRHDITELVRALPQGLDSLHQKLHVLVRSMGAEIGLGGIEQQTGEVGVELDTVRGAGAFMTFQESAAQAPCSAAFDDFEQYMQSLRDLKLDPARAQEFPAEAKLVAGLGVIAGGLDDRFRVRRGTMSNLWSLMAAPEFFTEARLGAILDHTREIGSVIKYFDGTLAPADAGRIEQALLDAERQLDPGHGEERYLATLRDIGDRLRAGSRV